MEVIDSPFPKCGKSKFLNISPIRKKCIDNEVDFDLCKHRFFSVQRRLSFNNANNDRIEDKNNNNPTEISKEQVSIINEVSTPNYDRSESPPYKRVKALTFDSSTPCNGRKTPPSSDISLISSVNMSPKPYIKYDKYKLSPIAPANYTARLRYTAPVNPFTPTGRVIVSANYKRKQKQREILQDWFNGNSSEEFSIDSNSSKRLSDSETEPKSILGPTLHELETSRFSEEFKVNAFLASGSFGTVYKCTSYLDGIDYAIKKSSKPVAGTNYEHISRREVYAHAALRCRLHIVTYYSAWIEAGHLYIQTEYCNGGSLEQRIQNGYPYSELNLRRLTNHISKGLKYIHSQNLAHMDIKPANILISKINMNDSSDEDFYDDIDNDEDTSIIYKIGDLGNITVADEPYDVEDGDCRYMPKELLNENYDNLKKADIFSFGMTLFETAGGGPLPKNGDQWQNLRNGNIPYLLKYSPYFNNTIKSMLHPEPEKRPDIKYILRQTRITRGRLHRDICSYKNKSDFYAERMHAARKCLKVFPFSPPLETSQKNDMIPKIVIDHS